MTALRGDVEGVRRLLHAGASPNARMALGGGGRFVTPLFAAIESGAVAAVAALLDAGADPDVGAQEGNAPLLACAMQPSEELALQMLRLVLAKNPRPRAANI